MDNSADMRRFANSAVDLTRTGTFGQCNSEKICFALHCLFRSIVGLPPVE